MNLTSLFAKGKLQRHHTSPEEIRGLLELINRDIQNASVEELTPDWRFAIAYNAALNLATIPLLLAGYRTVPSKGGHHYITLSILTETLGKNEKARVRFLNTCRTKRHTTTYDSICLITEEEVKMLLEEVITFQKEVIAWLKAKHHISLPSSSLE